MSSPSAGKWSRQAMLQYLVTVGTFEASCSFLKSFKGFKFILKTYTDDKISSAGAQKRPIEA
jgi:hypothetical protein